MKKTVLKNNKTLNSIDFLDCVSEKLTTTGETIKEIPINKIKIKENVRKVYKDEDIKEMAETIKEKGLLQPIIVVKAEDNFYEIIFGHRRYKGFVFLNKEDSKNYLKIKCIVKNKNDFDEDEIKEIQIIENIQRENLSVLELKESLKYFRNKGFSHKNIANKLGKSEGYIKNIFSSLKILDKNKELNQLVESNLEVTFLKDFQIVKPLPFKQQIELLKKRFKGEIKTQKELQEKVFEVKEDNWDISHENHLKKKNYDIFTVKENGIIKVKGFDYKPGKTTEEEKQKLLEMLKTLINKLENKTELDQKN